MSEILKVSMDVPINIRFKFDSDRVLANIGVKLASKMRRAMKRGANYDGVPLPVPKATSKWAPSTAPFNRTGELISKIKYNHKSQSIMPMGKHSKASKRAGSAYGLLSILMSGKVRGGENRPTSDPLGSESPNLYADAAAQLEKAIAKEIKSGKANLWSELKRVRTGKR